MLLSYVFDAKSGHTKIHAMLVVGFQGGVHVDLDCVTCVWRDPDGTMFVEGTGSLPYYDVSCRNVGFQGLGKRDFE